jgi:hypothetical protein
LARRIELIVTQFADLARVRFVVQRLAEQVPLPHGDVVLVANELVTNALLYTPGPCVLRGWIPLTGAALRVEVGDPIPVRLPEVTQPRPWAADGRGLVIVDQLVTRGGVELRAPEGKVVWFEIDHAA